MRLRVLPFVLAVVLLVAPDLSEAQATGKTYHVGILSIGTNQPSRWEPFIEAMKDLNYVEGKNLVIKRAFGAGAGNRLPGLIAELMNAKVDVIVTTGTREIRALKQATSTIPIVMTLAANPVAEGFVDSLARPGGNVTGLTSLVPGLSQKYVELLREVVPSASRLAIVGMPPNPIPEIRRELEAAAKGFGMTVIIAQPSGPEEFDRVLGQAKKDGAAGIVHPLDGGTTPHRPALVRQALKHGLPGVYWDRAYVEAGGLMTYSVSFSNQLRRAATFVDKILRGAKPADLPVEQPTRVELVINMKTAKALGITIPRSMLVRADEVIE